jgi:SNF2 family DNA or RNA helicase
LVNFSLPGILSDLAGFRRIYERPMSQSNQKNASVAEKEKGRRASKALEAITSHFVLRRLQADILNKLLKKRTEVLLFCRPTENQCKIYQSIAERAKVGGVDESSNPLMLITELRKLCTHPSLLNDDEALDDASLSGKLIVLGNLLDSIRRLSPTDKVVIISNFTSALTVIEDCLLRKKGLSFVRLDGSTDNKSRGTIVDTFNRCSVDNSFAFLLSSKAGGCGLNLIGANRLIMVDADWNPATDHQAMARIFREGQTKPCFIYRMFTAGTVEEVIYQRQLQKGNLAKLANDGKSSTNAASFSKEELRDCFTLKRECKCDTKRKLGKKWSEFNVDRCDDMPLLQIYEDQNVTFVRVVEHEEESSVTQNVDNIDEDLHDDNMESKSERSFSEEEEFDE